MTEKTLKEKIKESEGRRRIQNEIDNYTTSLKQGTKFATYTLAQIEKLEVQLEEFNNACNN
jgi:hypothetical protein